MSRPRNSVKMVVEWDRCIRVPLGDEPYMRQGVPYKCGDCAKWGDYNGKLIFKGDEIPYCTEHRRNFRPTRPDLVGSHLGAKRGTMKTAAA